MDRARGLDGCDHRKGLVARHGLRRLLLIQPGLVGLRREPILLKAMTCTSTRPIVLEDFIQGGKYRDKLDEETKERVDTAYREMKEHVHLDWPQSGKE